MIHFIAAILRLKCNTFLQQLQHENAIFQNLNNNIILSDIHCLCGYF